MNTDKPLRIFVLLLALGQVGMGYFGGFTGQGSYSGALINPAGYAFSIWGVIMLGCVMYGIYQLLPSQKNKKVYDVVALPLIALFTGFSVWIFAAARDYLWSTVIIFMGMFIAQWIAYPLFKKIKKFTTFESIVIKGTFGLYLGWSTAAIPLNVVAALVYYRYIYADERSTPLFLIVLLYTFLSALWVQRFIGKNYYFTGAIIWAFIAIAVGSAQNGSLLFPLIAIVASVGMGTFAYILNGRINT